MEKMTIADTTPVTATPTTELEALMRAAVLEHLGVHPHKDEETPPKSSKPVAKAEEKPIERVLRKLDACVKHSGIEISNKEKKALMAFLTADEVVESAPASIFKLVPSDSNLLESGLSADEKFFTKDGINAVQRLDKKERQVLNICYPALDDRLHTVSYSYELRKAFADWVIYLKNLQVKGCRVNGKLDESKEVKSDREYLNKVLQNFMTSEVAAQIAKAIGHNTVYSEVYTTSVVYIQGDDGKAHAKALFRTEAVEHARSMAEAFSNADHAEDLLQGSLDFLDVAGVRVAMFDMAKPSLYLHKGKLGYRPNLYIPSEMLQEFLAVEVSEEAPVSEETGTAEVVVTSEPTNEVQEITAEAAIPD